jgi:hypothetical protein
VTRTTTLFSGSSIGFGFSFRAIGRRASADIELRQAAGVRSALEMSGASPQRLLSEDPGDLARVTRQGNGEGVLTLSEPERSALLASTFEVAAKGAVECCGVEAGYA